jgi:hypothetical protein
MLRDEDRSVNVFTATVDAVTGVTEVGSCRGRSRRAARGPEDGGDIEAAAATRPKMTKVAGRPRVAPSQPAAE